jgi:hypothetical protein
VSKKKMKRKNRGSDPFKLDSLEDELDLTELEEASLDDLVLELEGFELEDADITEQRKSASLERETEIIRGQMNRIIYLVEDILEKNRHTRGQL